MSLIKNNIKAIAPYSAGKSIEQVKEKYGLKNVIKLGSNENPLGTSPRALEAMSKELENSAIYPDGESRDLVKALSKFYQLPDSYILPANGSDEILLLLTGAYLGSRDKVLVSENTFSQYDRISKIFDGEVISIPLKNFTYDLQAFENYSKNEKIKIIYLCNPNNPTGTYFTHNEILNFLNHVPEETLVVIDEAYAEFANNKDFPNSKELVKTFSNLIVCRTFSKMYGLAGLRAGYAVAQDILIDGLKRVKNFNPFNVNRMAQKGAVAALQDHKFFQESLDLVIRGRNYLSEQLKNLSLEVLDSQANFICFRCDIPSSHLCEELLKVGIIIRSLTSFEMNNWNRVSVGTDDQNQAFVHQIKIILG